MTLSGPLQGPAAELASGGGRGSFFESAGSSTRAGGRGRGAAISATSTSCATPTRCSSDCATNQASKRPRSRAPCPAGRAPGSTIVDPERAGPRPDNRPVAYFVPASPDYFRTLGLKLKAGRTFTEGDRAEAQPVTVVDELFVRQFLGSRDPLTQRVFLAIDDSIPRQIIGVVATVKQAGIDADERPTTYLPLAQAPAPDMAVPSAESGPRRSRR